jgi:hypothetical protein
MEGCREGCKADLVTKLLRLPARVRLDGSGTCAEKNEPLSISDRPVRCVDRAGISANRIRALNPRRERQELDNHEIFVLV